jgi:hypothetical protein
MAILPSQYAWLEQWRDGEFDADWPSEGLRFPERLEHLAVAEQPDALDRAALDQCLGGPFHPGCEMTWPMRRASLYAAPFRLRRRTGPEQDWGPAMTSEIALAADGPLTASGAGDITRWMAVPWQTDTSSCLSGYIREVDVYLPTFWPARAPNDVLDPEQFAAVGATSSSTESRQRAFQTRVKWLRDLPGFGASSEQRINAFIRQWHLAGVVTQTAGPTDVALFPETFWVEMGHALFNDTAQAPQPEPPADPTVGDLAGPATVPAATPEG